MGDLRDRLMEINVENYWKIAEEILESDELQIRLEEILKKEEDQSVLIGAMLALWEMWRRRPESILPYLPLVAARAGFHLRPVRDYATTLMLKVAETHPQEVAKYAETVMHRFDGDPYEQDDAVRFLALIADRRPDLVRRYRERILELSKSSNPLLRLHASRLVKRLGLSRS